MPDSTIFPALRCRMGDWIYYVTFMSCKDIIQWVRPTEEIYKSKYLREWIQRDLIEKHAEKIATYLQNQEERMFNAIFVGIYGGEPRWGEIQISSTLALAPFEVTDDQLDNLSRSVGILHFSGEEKLFAIDGQHRVAGVKLALEQTENKNSLNEDEITVILVGHKTDQTGRERTRRLFTTLNKTAKRVSNTDIIALDEDNGAAIVTRRMIDDFTLFREGKLIAFTSTANISESDLDSITGVITLYDIVKTLAGCVGDTRGFTNDRPDDKLLNSVYNFCCSYWDLLQEIIPEYQKVFLSNKIPASTFRQPDNNHLLFRPVGQRAFAEATTYLIKKCSFGLDEAIKELSQADLWLHFPKWHYILWNPIGKTMISTAKNRRIAKSHLLKMIGRDEFLTPKQSQDYQEFMESREAEIG